MLRAIDALEINFVDSAARSEFKLNTSTERGGGKSKGIGEKRLYITNTKDPKELDDFFEFNITKYFFFKNDFSRRNILRINKEKRRYLQT